MPYVYRRPFDYAQRRQTFNDWQLASSIEASAATASFTTFSASITSTLAGASATYDSRATRFSAQGVYRRRWNYAVQSARINLFYTDAVEIQANTATASFTTFPADVRVGASSGGIITAGRQELSFTTFPATITGARRDPINDAVGTFQTFAASITRTAGLGESKVGTVPAQGTGTYFPGRVNVKGRSGRKVSPMREIVRRK